MNPLKEFIGKKDFDVSQWALDIEEQRHQQVMVKRNSGVGEKLALTQAKANRMLASLDRQIQYAEMQSGYGLILNSLGIDPLPSTMSTHDLETLTRSIESCFESDLPKQIKQALVDAKAVDAMAYNK